MKKVLIDVDTGIDDAFAIIAATQWSDVEIMGIGCVSGNTNVHQVFANTKKVLSVTKHEDIPVGVGASRPLLGAPLHSTQVHGTLGLGHIQAPDLGTESNTNALDLYRRVIENNPHEVTLIALAPLTNVALLFRAFPEVTRKLKEIVIMGGSINVGNATPVSEFNFWHDPEAAKIVVESDLPVKIFPLDVFEQTIFSATEFRESLQETANPLSDFIADLLSFKQIGYEQREFGMLGDAAALMCAINPSFGTLREFPVHVETGNGRTKGQSVFDNRNIPGEDVLHGTGHDSQKVQVFTEIDFPAIATKFIELIARGAK